MDTIALETVRSRKIPLWVRIAAGILIALAGILFIYSIDQHFNSEQEDQAHRDAFITFALDRDHSTELAEQLYDNSILTKQLFDMDKNTLESVLEVASANATDLPKNLAYQVLDKIEKDSGVENKTTLAKNVFDNLVELEAYGFDRVSSVWCINNATRHGFEGLEGLKRALQFSEGNNVSLNFENTLCHSALADVGHYFPQIFKYPQEAEYLALQVGDAIYLFEIDKIKGKDYVWTGLVIPYSGWRFERLENGTFESLGHKLRYGELAELSEWTHQKVVEAAARSMYPFDELMDHDLLGHWELRYDNEGRPYAHAPRYFHDENFEKALERGITNINHNETIGASPFEYIYDLLQEDKSNMSSQLIYDVLTGNKTEICGACYLNPQAKRYGNCICNTLYATPNDIWTNSFNAWKTKLLENETIDDIDTYLTKGYPGALKHCPPSVNPNFHISEQATPFYSKIIGAMLNRPTIVLNAYYPTYHTGAHEESFTINKKGELSGFWYKLDAFLDDYDIEKNPRATDEFWKNNEPPMRLHIASDRIGKRFECDQLDKVLNS